jgi:hypothetical protein
MSVTSADTFTGRIKQNTKHKIKKTISDGIAIDNLEMGWGIPDKYANCIFIVFFQDHVRARLK